MLKQAVAMIIENLLKDCKASPDKSIYKYYVLSTVIGALSAVHSKPKVER